MSMCFRFYGLNGVSSMNKDKSYSEHLKNILEYYNQKHRAYNKKQYKFFSVIRYTLFNYDRHEQLLVKGLKEFDEDTIAWIRKYVKENQLNSNDLHFITNKITSYLQGLHIENDLTIIFIGIVLIINSFKEILAKILDLTPKTTLDEWSVGVTVLFIVSMIIYKQLVNADNKHHIIKYEQLKTWLISVIREKEAEEKQEEKQKEPQSDKFLLLPQASQNGEYQHQQKQKASFVGKKRK